MKIIMKWFISDDNMEKTHDINISKKLILLTHSFHTLRCYWKISSAIFHSCVASSMYHQRAIWHGNKLNINILNVLKLNISRVYLDTIALPSSQHLIATPLFTSPPSCLWGIDGFNFILDLRVIVKFVEAIRDYGPYNIVFVN